VLWWATHMLWVATCNHGWHCRHFHNVTLPACTA
jgi:hypothetical protein